MELALCSENRKGRARMHDGQGLEQKPETSSSFNTTGNLGAMQQPTSGSVQGPPGGLADPGDGPGRPAGGDGATAAHLVGHWADAGEQQPAAARGARQMATELAPSFGLDPAGIRVRTDQKAPLDRIGANAAAQGETLLFASEQPSRQLVAHELVHVAQHRQIGAAPRNGQSLSERTDPAETEARELAGRAAAGARVQVTQALSAKLHLDEGSGPVGASWTVGSTG
jgi:hypothetical protein